MCVCVVKNILWLQLACTIIYKLVYSGFIERHQRGRKYSFLRVVLDKTHVETLMFLKKHVV